MKRSSQIMQEKNIFHGDEIINDMASESALYIPL